MKIYCLRGIEDTLEIFQKKTVRNLGCPPGSQTPNLIAQNYFLVVPGVWTPVSYN